MGIMALLYNWGFFTMLGYAPYPMELGAHQLGLVFFGWGLLVAAFSVLVAPRLQARFGTAKVLYANLAALAIVMVVIAAGVSTPHTVIVAVIVSGAFIGINNTLTTQAVMLVSPVERSVASSAYGFVRFIGGGLAPFVAGKLADHFNLGVPFYLGGLAFLLAIAVLATGHRLITAAESPTTAAPAIAELATGHRLITEAESRTTAPAAETGPVLVAVGATADAAETINAAAAVARELGAPLEVVRVRETVVIEELAIEPEAAGAAQSAVDDHLRRLESQGVTATGMVLTSVGDHAAAGRALAQHASDVSARVVAVGRSGRGAAVQFADGSFTAALTHAAATTVILVGPDHDPHPLTATTLPELRGV
jgi:ACDE family multidrug resistance protein